MANPIDQTKSASHRSHRHTELVLSRTYHCVTRSSRRSDLPRSLVLALLRPLGHHAAHNPSEYPQPRVTFGTSRPPRPRSPRPSPFQLALGLGPTNAFLRVAVAAVATEIATVSECALTSNDSPFAQNKSPWLRLSAWIRQKPAQLRPPLHLPLDLLAPLNQPEPVCQRTQRANTYIPAYNRSRQGEAGINPGRGGVDSDLVSNGD
ncbi:hypothetical protein DFH07DRAFT_965107 [Mycena maculata]|uniref:Uncharacterized protein n=1 Tax=Mycena maculata TaxID=230809 RepID=A0AAD7IEE5_9AGAR|nr:hypothetical protein DFH07DRAFT_965107 [Mycena maculata]